VASVKVQVLKAVLVEDRLVLTGNVEPWEDIMVSSEARGRIEWQEVKEGDSVQAGQELIKIDTSVVRAQLDQARAQEKLAGQELERIETLSAKGLTTAQALDKVRAEHDIATANAHLVQIQLTKSVVTAPIAGVIDKLVKDRDEYADMGAALVRIVQIQKVKVRAGIPERDIPCFAKGDSVKVVLDALQGREFSGVIHQIGTTADPATLTFAAEIAVDNPDVAIKPGMIARVKLVRKSFPDSLVAPMFAILSLENARFVFVEDQGVARGRPIEVGVLQGNSVQVTKGLDAGDRLIVSGQRDLKDGDSVNVLEVLE
jgi:membrane fusion protein (multidrug efflux system)